MTLRRTPLAIASLFVLALACSETPPDETGDDGQTTGGVAGSTAGTPGAGTAGVSPGGQSGTAGQAQGGASAGTGAFAGQGGSAGAGTGGQAAEGGGGAAGTPGGSGGISGAAGAAGSAGQSGGAGAGAGGAGGNGGPGGSGGRGGAAGSAGNGGTGGTAAYNPCPAAPAPCVILPYGDSITDGYNVPGGYRIPLFSRTLTDQKRITFVGSGVNGPTMVDGQPFPQNHEGHSGWTIDSDNQGHSGISTLVNAAIGRNPNIVLLMIGTNDLNGNVDPMQAPTRLGNLLDSMFTRRADMLVVVAQIVPGRMDTLNARVRTYNAAIPGLVATRVAAGRHIISVDMYAAFTRDTNYKTALLADDLHPSTAGYARMADTWYAAIGSLLH